MQEQEYYQEIENYIKKNEVNKRTRVLEENYDTLNNFWHIGKILVEAQGGSSRAKYGNELIKKWSIDFINKYGKGYDENNLKRFRLYYNTFPISGTLCHHLTWKHLRYFRRFYLSFTNWDTLCLKLSWSQIRAINPVKDENKNYNIDILLFNIKLNCYIVVELKIRNLMKEDKGQLEFYMELIDKTIKVPIYNKTFGIRITKEQDKFIANFIRRENIIPLT